MENPTEDIQTLDMEKNSSGVFEFSGKVFQEKDQTGSSKEERGHSSDGTEFYSYETRMSSGNSDIAEKLRMANEDYLSDVRNRFEASRKEMMEMMSAMTNIRNIKY